MKEDQDLFYMAGELTDAEVAEFEALLSPEDKRQSQLLRQAFAGLPTLKDAIPEPQISFERVQDAILKSEPAPVRGGAGWNWRKLFMLGTPMVAAGLLVGLVVKQQQPGVVPEVDLGPRRIEASSSLALGPSPAGGIEGEPRSVRGGSDAVEEVESSRPVVVQVTPPTTETKAPSKVALPSRPAPRRLVARLDRDFARPSAGLMKRGTPGGASIERVNSTLAAPSVAAPSTMAADSTPAVSHFSRSEPVVVVTTTPDEASGANTAIEVNRQDDVILGG